VRIIYGIVCPAGESRDASQQWSIDLESAEPPRRLAAARVWLGDGRAGHISSTSLSVTTGNLFDRLVVYDLKLHPQPHAGRVAPVGQEFTRVRGIPRKFLSVRPGQGEVAGRCRRRTRRHDGLPGVAQQPGIQSHLTDLAPGDPITAFSNGRGTDPNSNNEGYKNDTNAQLIAAGAAEPDGAKRKQIYSQLNDILLEDAFVMVLAPYPPRLVRTSAVHDIVTPNSQPTNFIFTDAWLAP